MKFILWFILLIPLDSPANPIPMCDSLRNSISMLSREGEMSSVNLAYACQNRLTSIRISFAPSVPYGDYVKLRTKIANNVCTIFTDQYHAADDLGKEFIELFYEGGFVIILTHPYTSLETIYIKSLEDCLNTVHDSSEIKGEMYEQFSTPIY